MVLYKYDIEKIIYCVHVCCVFVLHFLRNIMYNEESGGGVWCEGICGFVSFFFTNTTKYTLYKYWERDRDDKIQYSIDIIRLSASTTETETK